MLVIKQFSGPTVFPVQAQFLKKNPAGSPNQTPIDPREFHLTSFCLENYARSGNKASIPASTCLLLVRHGVDNTGSSNLPTHCANYFKFEIIPSSSPCSLTGDEILPLHRLNYHGTPCTIKYRHLMSPDTIRLGGDGNQAQSSKYLEHGDKRKRGGDAGGPKLYALVALLTDSQPMVSEFEKLHESFEKRGIEAVYFSLVDLETYGSKATSDSAAPSINVSLETSVQKYYTTTKNPTEMKVKILEWVSANTVTTREGDTVVLIPIGHGIGTGSMLIGQRKTPSAKAYLTAPEIKESISKIGARASFTLVNTAWYYGGWIPIRAPVEDTIRFIRCRPENESVSSSAGKCFEGGTSALLSTLRRSEGTGGDYLEELLLEVRDTETVPNPFDTVGPIDLKAIAKDDEWYHAVFWRTIPTALVPFDPSHVLIQDTLIAVIHSLHRGEFRNLYHRLARSRVPDLSSHSHPRRN
jgi:hypothetical protein